MHVLMVGPFPEDLDRPAGGVEAAVANLVVALGSLPGVAVDVVSNSGASGGRIEPHPFGTVTYIPQGPGFRGWVRDLHGHLVREVRRREPDIVHVQGLASLTARLPGSVLTVHGITERDIWESGGGVRRIARFGGALILEGIPRTIASRVIAISDMASQRLRYRGHRVWTIPNAIHPRYFSAGGQVRRGDPNVFLTAGAISPIKNTAELITTFHQVATANDSVRLLLAGSGLDTDYGRHCIELVDRFHLQQHVAFLGYQSGPQIAGLLQQSGTLVQFSRQENAPMAVAEALAAGAAVIGSNVGSIAEMLRGLPGCHVVPVGDARSLASRLLEAAAAEDEAHSLRRHEAARQYSPQTVSQQTLAVYREIAGSSRRGVGQHDEETV